jgi:hypothetical protein
LPQWLSPGDMGNEESGRAKSKPGRIVSLRTQVSAWLCGKLKRQLLLISGSDLEFSTDADERFMGQLIVSRASVHGFLVLDWWHRRR